MTLRAELAPVTDHGGSLDEARRRFPGAAQPWIDMSTGINPHAYPQLHLPTDALTRLPEPRRVDALRDVAALYYSAPSAANIVAAPGTQILLPRVAATVRPGRALVLGPTYAEHIRAAATAGHQASYANDFEALFDADIAIIVNPNNPDGRVIERDRQLALATHLQGKGGLLVVDEAFMDVGPLEHSVADDVESCGVIVLKSFGKFFGLAGIRLGFALAPRRLADRLSAELGPWAVSGTALEYGLSGLADSAWQTSMRIRLKEEADMLDGLLAEAGYPVCGGTSLFRFLRTPFAMESFEALGRAGILVRRFGNLPDALRFGLPACSVERERLAAALRVVKHAETHWATR